MEDSSSRSTPACHRRRRKMLLLALGMSWGFAWMSASARLPRIGDAEGQTATIQTTENISGDQIYLAIIVAPTAATAEALHQRLVAGWDFAVLAKEESIDSTFRNGGYMGYLSPTTLSPEVQAALTGLKPGEMTKVVQIATGFAIVKVLAQAMPTEDLSLKDLPPPPMGTVRPGAYVAGVVEADDLIQGYPKPDNWNRDQQQLCKARTESHAAGIGKIYDYIEAAKGPEHERYLPLDVMNAHSALAQLYAYSGELEKSVEEWKRAHEIAEAIVPGALPNLEEGMGVTYLHWSEMENGAYTHPADFDMFPPVHPGASYARPEKSRLAIQHLLKYLEAVPDSLEGKWLLNLAYATLGEYPRSVPPAYLIPASVFASKQDIGRFKDVAPAAGLNVFLGAGGAIVEDFDNDGLLDVVVSSTNVCDPMHFFHNNGDGSFSDRTQQAGLADQLGGLNVVDADYNNDGCMDLLVLRGGWEFPMPKSLLRNNCDGSFTDVTAQSGVGATLTQTQTATWADIDNDGLLDLFIGNENSTAQLFHNKGDGTFEDISHSSGVDLMAYTKGVTAGDYDNDGYMDFYVSNNSGANFLYRNNHDKTFVNVARQAGVEAPLYSFATWFFDYDNDGWPDLFVTSYLGSVSDTIRTYLGLPPNVETLKLYRNKHDGTFEDVTAKLGLDKVFMPMGSNFGDVDNDGYLDIYLGCGNPSFTSLVPHVLLRNDAARSFVDITTSSGTGELHKGHGIAFADLDRSGHEAIVAVIGGAVPSDRHTLRVFENPGQDNDWLNVKLRGVKSNRSAVGARIEVTVRDDDGAPRKIYRTVGGTSSFGGNPMEQHIGLGHKAQIVAVDIWWPASGTRQHFSDIASNQYIAIEEFASGYTHLDRPRFHFGGGRAQVPAHLSEKQAVSHSGD